MPSNRCDSCEVVMINGVRCHEHGCPNRNYAKRGRIAGCAKEIREEGKTAIIIRKATGEGV